MSGGKFGNDKFENIGTVEKFKEPGVSEMENIKIIKCAIKRKHPCDPVHKAVSDTENSLIDLVMAWNDLPDDIRLSKTLDPVAEIIMEIGGA